MNSPVLTGLLIGALAAVAISSFIALFQLNSGAPWKELLKEWGMLLVLTVPAFASTTAAALLAWRYRRDQPLSDFRLPDVVVSPQRIPTAEHPRLLSEVVVQNARDQASWHYEYGSQEPTRRAFEGEGISQTIWNSARHVLTTAKIVNGNEWSPEPWTVIEEILNAIHAESDRVWVRPLGERSMTCLHINEQAIGKRHTVEDRPTPPMAPPLDY